MNILASFFGQTAQWNDLAIIGLLVILEGILSIDNALVLGLLAKRLPKKQQKLALTYGLVGAFVFRILAIATASYLLKWRVVKLLGGGYLVYVAIKHFIGHDAGESTTGLSGDTGMQPKSATGKFAKFWPTVMVIELTDIAFAIDSILAAIALVGAPPKGHDPAAFHPKLWVVVAGGMLGVILMRFAAVMFIKLLEKFPRFETSAYLLVLAIGGKLLADWGFNSEAHPHRINFHNFSSWPFWVFWVSMLVCIVIGFIPKRKTATA